LATSASEFHTQGNFDENLYSIRFDEINVDENQDIAEKTCTFKGAYKHLTN